METVDKKECTGVWLALISLAHTDLAVQRPVWESSGHCYVVSSVASLDSHGDERTRSRADLTLVALSPCSDEALADCVL